MRTWRNVAIQLLQLETPDNMIRLLQALLFAHAARGAAMLGDASSLHGEKRDALHHMLEERAMLGPIGTGSAAGLAGGSVACDAAPVSSFFQGMKPPVSDIFVMRSNCRLGTNFDAVPYQLVVGILRCGAWQWHRRRPISVPVIAGRIRSPIWHQCQSSV